MAAAGPAANLLLVALAGLLLRLGLAAEVFTLPTGRLALDGLVAPAVGWANALAPLLSILFSLNLILFVFNLFPLPPLDGSAVYPPLISEDAARKWKSLLAAQPALSLLGLVIAWRLFGPVFEPVFVAALGVLFAGL